VEGGRSRRTRRFDAIAGSRLQPQSIRHAAHQVLDGFEGAQHRSDDQQIYGFATDGLEHQPGGLCEEVDEWFLPFAEPANAYRRD
jgi:hypothetical protein